MSRKSDYTPEELTKLADKHLAHNYGYPPNVVFRSGKGCLVYDTTGKKYLDFMSCYSALSIGFGHPAIMEAAREHLKTGFTAMSRSFLQEQLILFVSELAEVCGMEMILPMNSGAEAVETAMKIARKWGYVRKEIKENKAEIIFCENNFHGRTLGVISGSTTKSARKDFGPFLPGTPIVRFGDISDVRRAINKNTAAIIIEPIQAEGGIIVPPEGFFTQLRELCTKENVLLIADEIQTGFGRTGHMFACEYENIVPDLYILGKALGGGFPISAVAGPESIMGVLEPGDHGSTFGGNPFACHVARASMRVIREEQLSKRALARGAFLHAGLDTIAERYPNVITEIRGRGLLIGVEMNEDGPKAKDLCTELMREGLLTKETREHTLRFSPALIISEEEIEQALKIIEKVFSKI